MLLPPLWQLFDEEPHVSVMVRCPYTLLTNIVDCVFGVEYIVRTKEMTVMVTNLFYFQTLVLLYCCAFTFFIASSQVSGQP